MEFEELQKTWNKMNQKIESQAVINEKLVLEMTKINFRNRLGAILHYEGIGAMVIFTGLIFLISQMHKLDTLPLQICGVVTLVIMIILPLLSLSSIYRMRNIDVSRRNCRQMVIDFTKRRLHFLFVQKLGIAMGGILMFTFMPITLKISSGKDFFNGDSNNSLWFLPIASIGFYFISKWVYSCYSSIAREAQSTLSDLNE